MPAKSWGLLIALALAWSSSFLFTELLLPHFTPAMIVFLRVSLAGLILAVIAGRALVDLNLRDVLRLCVMGQLANAIPFTLIVIGQQTTTGGLASILNASTGLTAILVAAIFFADEKLTLRRCVGVGIGLIGVAICVDLSFEDFMSSKGVGKYLILLATVSYAFANAFGKISLSHLSPKVAAAGMTLSAAVSLGVVVLFTGIDELAILNLTLSLYVLGYAFFASVVAYLLYFKVLEVAGAGNLGLSALFIPPFALFFDATLLGQFVTVSELAGFPVIVLGLLTIDGRIIDWMKRRLNISI